MGLFCKFMAITVNIHIIKKTPWEDHLQNLLG